MSDFKIDFPDSPWFWVLVAIAAFLILLATGHPATAVVLLFLGVGIICLIANVSGEPQDYLWWVCGFCLLAALILGLILVPDEWRTQVMPRTQLEILTALFPLL